MGTVVRRLVVGNVGICFRLSLRNSSFCAQGTRAEREREGEIWKEKEKLDIYCRCEIDGRFVGE